MPLSPRISSLFLFNSYTHWAARTVCYGKTAISRKNMENSLEEKALVKWVQEKWLICKWEGRGTNEYPIGTFPLNGQQFYSFLSFGTFPLIGQQLNNFLSSGTFPLNGQQLYSFLLLHRYFWLNSSTKFHKIPSKILNIKLNIN